MKNKAEPIKTILVIVIGLLVVYLFTKSLWALYPAIAIGLLGLFSSYLAKKIDYVWMKLVWLLSKVMPVLLLSIIFFLLLTPLALLSRLFGNKDPLTLKNTKHSLFKDSNKTFEKVTFEKSW